PSASPARSAARKGTASPRRRSRGAARWASASPSNRRATPATPPTTARRPSPATPRPFCANRRPRARPGLQLLGGRLGLAQNGNPFAEDLFDAGEKIVAGGNLVVVAERQDALAAHGDLHPQHGPAGAAVQPQELLERPQLALVDRVGVQLDVEQRALLGADARQRLGVQETEPLPRGLAFPEGGVDGAGHQERLVARQHLPVLLDLLRADHVLDL